MIEDAVIFVEDKPFQTRLHEHGKQPSSKFQPRFEWLYSGYIEGSEVVLTKLKNIQSDDLKIYQNGVLEIILKGIVWREVQQMYDDHWILHLNWAYKRK